MAPKVAITYAEKIYAVPGCEQDFQELLPENITPSSRRSNLPLASLWRPAFLSALTSEPCEGSDLGLLLGDFRGAMKTILGRGVCVCLSVFVHSFSHEEFAGWIDHLNIGSSFILKVE